MTDPQHARWFYRLELLVLAVGIGLRLARFLERRPLWLDEALLALNILTRPPLGYLRPLEHNQVAPVGFLWGEWFAVELGGTGERALRILPLAGAIAALIAFARLARRTLEPGMALFATTLAAFSPLLIYYSAEVKSYGLDWLCAILLMHATLTVIDDAPPSAWMRWSLAAAFSALVSTAAPFFIAGCALALVTAPHLRRDPGALRRLVAAGTPAALVFGLQLLTSYRSSSLTSFMQVYWTEAFLEPRLSSGVIRAVHVAREFWSTTLFGDAASLLPRKTMIIVMAGSVVGAIAIVRRSLPMAVLLLAPAVLAGLASFGKWWPLTPRLLLFAVPAVLITLAAGLGTVSRVVPQRFRALAQAIPAVAVIVVATMSLTVESRTDRRFIGVPEALREVGTRASQNATVYLSADLEAGCIYYLAWHPDRADLGGDPASKECAIRGTRTVIGQWPWFVGLVPGTATDAARTIRPDWLEREGRRIPEQPASELWVLIGYADLRTPLPAWIEATGAMRLSDRETGGIRILQYRRN